MRILMAGLLGGLVLFFWGFVANMLLPLGMLGSWCAHYGRWQAGLDAGHGGSAPRARRRGRAASWRPAWQRRALRHRCASR